MDDYDEISIKQHCIVFLASSVRGPRKFPRVFELSRIFRREFLSPIKINEVCGIYLEQADRTNSFGAAKMDIEIVLQRAPGSDFAMDVHARVGREDDLQADHC